MSHLVILCDIKLVSLGNILKVVICVLPGQNKMSDKNKRMQGGNEMVISTALKPVLVRCFGHSILSR